MMFIDSALEPEPARMFPTAKVIQRQVQEGPGHDDGSEEEDQHAQEQGNREPLTMLARTRYQTRTGSSK